MGHLWTNDLIVFTNGAALSPDEQADLEHHRVRVHTEPIQRLDSTDGKLLAVELATGERIERDAGFSGLIAAAAEGAACAETIVHEIATERWSNQ